ncbi:Glycosidase [Spirosomataceae bacterium TFI 002]|nr:Glycosidase [Spirosomataceae bacterium TFI 002]
MKLKNCPRHILALIFLVLCTHFSKAQIVEKVAPTNWWVGMKNPKLQVLLYGKNIASKALNLQKYKGVKLLKVNKVENLNYLFVDLEISKKAKPGKLRFLFDKQIVYEFELMARDGWQPAPMTQADLVYLLMPDRFSNGDPSNDKFRNMADTVSDRTNPWARHGGDLQGVINHLNYFNELGVTSLWLNPVIENDQSMTDEGGNMRSAYHGYGFTDHYKVDARFGGNAKYKELIGKAHSKELKIIQDAVYNHVGINHWTLKDMPMKDWLNQWDTYTGTNFKDQAIIDPHASQYDRNLTQNGWFMPFLPDLNQNNSYVANYLIQHALWTVEYFKIDAWRIDTYFYNDLPFMNKCNAAILAEYPQMHIFGESWVNSVANQAYFMENNINTGFKCNLPGNVDFQVYFAINAALNEKFGWNEGVSKLYQTLALDYLYKDPNKLVTFVDNHDLDRYFSVIGEDMRKFKLGLTWLMTMRGIPQLYYGTEILMKNFKNPTDAEVRKDFPGGWDEDKVNKFTSEGRTEEEQNVFAFVQKLAKFRKNSKAIAKGEFTQFMPFDDGIYAYFRHYGDEVVMVVSNTSEKSQTIETARFAEMLKGKTSGKEIISGKEITDLSKLTIEPYAALLIELK